MPVSRRLILAMFAALTVLAACGKKEPAPSATPPGEALISREVLMRGEQLYRENCSQCHGPDGQGHPDWQTPGVSAAPPLNGTGNDWKRSRAELVAVIKEGVKRKNEMVMPGWKGRLTDTQIEELIVWFQTFWPREVYERWLKANVATAPGKR
jgi:mono/diheme cytochrome c family protein